MNLQINDSFNIMLSNFAGTTIITDEGPVLTKSDIDETWFVLDIIRRTIKTSPRQIVFKSKCSSNRLYYTVIYIEIIDAFVRISFTLDKYKTPSYLLCVIYADEDITKKKARDLAMAECKKCIKDLFNVDVSDTPTDTPTDMSTDMSTDTPTDTPTNAPTDTPTDKR